MNSAENSLLLDPNAATQQGTPNGGNKSRVRPYGRPFIAAAGLAAVAGFSMMTIGLNQWLDKFAMGKGPYTTSLVTAVAWDFILVCLAVAWYAIKKPWLDFIFTRRAVTALAVIGFFEATAGLLTAYAAKGTDVPLQAMLGSSVVIFTSLFTAMYLRSMHTMYHWQFVSSLVLIVGGIALHTFVHESSSENHRDKKFTNADAWPAVYLLSVLLNAVHFVLQWRFMHRFTYRADRQHLLAFEKVPNNNSLNSGLNTSNITEHNVSFSDANAVQPSVASESTSVPPSLNTLLSPQKPARPRSGSRTESASGKSASGASVASGDVPTAAGPVGISTPSRTIVRPIADAVKSPGSAGGSFARRRAYHPSKGDDLTVKIMMLAVDTFFQMLVTLVLLPTDAIPGYGRSDNVEDAFHNTVDGFKCIGECDGNWQFFLLYLVGFAVSHLAATFLNHYSSTLTAVSILLSSPVTTLVLTIRPSWSPSKGAPKTPVWAAVVAACCLTAGALLFHMWEETESHVDGYDRLARIDDDAAPRREGRNPRKEDDTGSVTF